MEQPVRTKYVCQNPECQAEDFDRGNNLPAPKMLICWNCKAGRDQGSIGMLPVSTEQAA